MQSTLTLLGMSWSDDGPSLAIRRGDNEPVIEPLIGQRLRIEVDPTARRWCLGADGPSHSATPCLETPAEGRRTCTSCSVKNALFAGALHHAHRQPTTDPDVVKHLDQPNRLYLAAFRDGSIKVGTSTKHRALTRLCEQGAWMARFVATTSNGVLVRVVEDAVTEKLGLPQSVAITRKLAGLTSPREDAWLADQLSEQAVQVHDLLASQKGSNGASSIDGITATDERWQNPGHTSDLWNRVYAYPSRLQAGVHALEIVGACGSAVAFRRKAEGDVFVADLRPLFGLGLISTDEEPEPVTVQDQLF